MYVCTCCLCWAWHSLPWVSFAKNILSQWWLFWWFFNHKKKDLVLIDVSAKLLKNAFLAHQKSSTEALFLPPPPPPFKSLLTLLIHNCFCSLFGPKLFFPLVSSTDLPDLPQSFLRSFVRVLGTVWPGWAIYWTLGNFLKPLATNNLPNSSTFLGIFCKCVKIYHCSSELIFGQLL